MIRHSKDVSGQPMQSNDCKMNNNEEENTGNGWHLSKRVEWGKKSHEGDKDSNDSEK